MYLLAFAYTHTQSQKQHFISSRSRNLSEGGSDDSQNLWPVEVAIFCLTSFNRGRGAPLGSATASLKESTLTVDSSPTRKDLVFGSGLKIHFNGVSLGTSST